MAKYKKRKDGRYCTNVYTGEYGNNGQRIKITLYAKTIRELDSKVIELKYKLQNGGYIKSKNMHFSEYANSWYETYKSQKRTRTKQMYNYVLETYIKPEIGNLPLDKIVRSDIQNIIKKNYSHRRTCEQIRLVLNQIFRNAIDDDLLIKNPVTRIELPNKTLSSKRALTQVEKTAIQKADFNNRERAYIYILFYCGLRKCEALALTKMDFNFKRKEVSVNKDLIFVHNNPVIEDTKNAYSVRSIPLPDEAIPFLKIYLKDLPGIYLFTCADGKRPITESSYKRLWEGISKKINVAACSEAELAINSEKISGITAYTFRHNYATMLYYSGISLKKASEYMGHCDTKMILNVYSHLDEEKENAKEKMRSIRLA